MERDFATPENRNGGSKSGKRITAFTAIKQDYGFQIKVAGCVCLQAAQNGSKNVVGIITQKFTYFPKQSVHYIIETAINEILCVNYYLCCCECFI